MREEGKDSKMAEELPARDEGERTASRKAASSVNAEAISNMDVEQGRPVHIRNTREHGDKRSGRRKHRIKVSQDHREGKQESQNRMKEEAQNHRVTESLNHRKVEPQSHGTKEEEERKQTRTRLATWIKQVSWMIRAPGKHSGARK